MKRTPLARMSKRRKRESVEYMKLRKQFLADNPCCEVLRSLPSSEIHHKFCGTSRSKYYLDISTWMAVSRSGHEKIHQNPKWARENGYLY